MYLRAPSRCGGRESAASAPARVREPRGGRAGGGAGQRAGGRQRGRAASRAERAGEGAGGAGGASGRRRWGTRARLTGWTLPPVQARPTTAQLGPARNDPTAGSSGGNNLPPDESAAG